MLNSAMLKGMLLASRLAFGHLAAIPIAAAPDDSAPYFSNEEGPGAKSPPVREAPRSANQDALPAQIVATIATQSLPVLSPQADQVSRIAAKNGDQNFLMVDKARGEILLFENGRPTFSGAALTGESLGDRIPPKVLTFPDTHPLSTNQKVTPAGRFSVKREVDPDYGRVWTITEIHGKDWDIAIHRVYLGTPSEHRDVRLASPNPLGRHITYGCINVERSTIQLLARRLPGRGTVPLYVLPQDEAMTTSFFPLRDPAPSTLVRPSGGASH
jgi:L,D-transpeptidase catalytic domain